MKRAEAIQILCQNADALRRDYGVAHLDIFGSVARDEAGPDSDIDILVEYQKEARPGLFEFVGLKHHLEDLMGIKVDLATEPALKKQLKARILKEKVRAA